MIRRAILKDIEVIYKLGTLLHENFRKTNHLEGMLEDEKYKLFVYEQTGLILGFLSVIELVDTVDIQDIYVEEEHRRKHIASSLISYLMGDIADTISLITLEVDVNNTAAIRLYEKFGFEIVHKRLFYYGNSDAYLMGRRIMR